MHTTPEDIWSSHYSTPSGFRFWPCEELIRSVGSQVFGTVLEAGCGNGANLWYLAEHADFVIGVDLCADAVARAKTYMVERNVDRKVSLRVGDLHALPVPDGSVDAVVDVMTSQHVPWVDHAKIYAEYRRVLKVGGWLFRYGLGHGTTVSGAKQIGTFTFDELPALFPGVKPVCLPQGPALVMALNTAGFACGAVRQLSRTYAHGAVTAYSVIEARAI